MSTSLALVNQVPDSASGSIHGGWGTPGREPGPEFRDVLNRLAAPIFLIDTGVRVHFSNLAAQRLLRMKFCAIDGAGRLVLASRQASGELLTILARMADNRLDASVAQAFRLQRPGEAQAALVLVSPLCRDSTPPSLPQRFLVQVVWRICTWDLPGTVLKGLFGLTEREVEVVAELVRHGSLQVVAARLEISHETARAHLKHIFDKCDVNSQLELISTMQKLCMFCGPEGHERASA